MEARMSFEDQGKDQPFDDHFSVQEYLDYFYSDVMTKYDEDEGVSMPWILDQFHRTFAGERDFGNRLLDVGSGPTVYQLISASRVCSEIVCSDIHQGALAEIKRWKNGGENVFDWSTAVKYVSELEGTGWESRQEQLRTAIKDTVLCDVHKENPLHPAASQQFDTIITAYCLEGACCNKGRSTYANAMNNMCALLKQGGYLILQSYIGVTYYVKDGKRFPDNLNLDAEFVLKSISEAGITVLETSVYETPERETPLYSDVKALLHVIGKKN
ncbi:INMT [Branchiostoma lanceolatum]|uniref:INMT protein n=2 Tax=Branchiostoma lanceolatum TaxID=7740 RepID=A0A8J9W7C0_BRALA|nr:INMT [Branchiostoma lanceolatum]